MKEYHVFPIRIFMTVCILLALVSGAPAQQPASSASIDDVIKALEAREASVSNVIATAVVRTYRTDWDFICFDTAIRQALKPDYPIRTEAEIRKQPHQAMTILEMSLGRDVSQLVAQGIAGLGDQWFPSGGEQEVADQARNLRITATDGQRIFDFSRAEGSPKLTVSPRYGQTAEFSRDPYASWFGLALGGMPPSKLLRRPSLKMLPLAKLEDALLLELADIETSKQGTFIHETRFWMLPAYGYALKRFERLTIGTDDPATGSRRIVTWDDFAPAEGMGPFFARRWRSETFYYNSQVDTPHARTQIVDFEDYPVNSTIPQPTHAWAPLGTLVVIDPRLGSDDSTLAAIQNRARRLEVQRVAFEREGCPAPDGAANRKIGKADLDALLAKYGLVVPK
ncbi:MAG: hypothetical protein ABFE08_15590 [Armatimonadia bacterium]